MSLGPCVPHVTCHLDRPASAASGAITARAAVLGVEQVLERPPSQSDLLNFVAGAIG